MAKICGSCGHWIEFVPSLGWVDEDNDDQCYDEYTNLTGVHYPVDY